MNQFKEAGILIKFLHSQSCNPRARNITVWWNSDVKSLSKLTKNGKEHVKWYKTIIPERKTDETVLTLLQDARRASFFSFPVIFFSDIF